ncbi:unnamed protein product, partial [Brachionus calyciflorus]
SETDNYMSFESAQDLYDFSNIKYGSNKSNHGTQHERTKTDASNQTSPNTGTSNQLEFPDLEKEAKELALSKACSKKCSFDVQSLANFIDKCFREMYPDNDLSEDELVSNRPYFEGHEREDVVIARKKFLQSLLDSKDFYYCPHYENGILKWMEPVRNKKLFVSHDESIFRSGEVSSYRWIFLDQAPFFNKGKGRSIMISIFMIQSKTVDLFELDEEEYKEALRT